VIYEPHRLVELECGAKHLRAAFNFCQTLSGLLYDGICVGLTFVVMFHRGFGSLGDMSSFVRRFHGFWITWGYEFLCVIIATEINITRILPKMYSLNKFWLPTHPYLIKYFILVLVRHRAVNLLVAPGDCSRRCINLLRMVR
jgi:hypothetical protein